MASRVENILAATLNGEEYTEESFSRIEDQLIELNQSVINGGGGSNTGGTTDYNALRNKPSIEGVTLSGDKSLSDIGAAEASDLNSLSATIDTKANNSDLTTLSNLVATKADSSSVYTKTETNNVVDEQITKLYRPGGDKVAAELTESLLTESNLGLVYNVTDTLQTTSLFTNGAGKSYGTGADVAVVNAGTNDVPVYRFNVLPGYLETVSNNDIDAMFD